MPITLRYTAALACLAGAFCASHAAAQTLNNRADDESQPPIGFWITLVKPAKTVSVRVQTLLPAPSSTAAAHDESGYRLAGPRITGEPHALDGLASFYGQGTLTAAGEPFDKRAMTAAHKTLPFGTKVRVTRVDTGSSVVVRINDRGPFKPGRVIDLSEGAAEGLGMTGVGLTSVRLEVLGR